jgi:CheY-like chemotaxis protein/HPt (histidine-containing phosphotransfer) domain-containing protein
VFDFTIELGMPEQQPALEDAAAATALAVPEAAMRGLSCLVVDDNAVARTVLREMAASFGWRVDVAAGGYEALDAIGAQLARRKAYDVVFIDWRMPGLDGWETSCRIRELAPEGKTPLIVMVTAHDRELLAQRHKEMAPVLDGFVVKPVTASMLFDAVAEAKLEQRKPLTLVSAPAQRRLAGVRLLLVDDNAANQQVASELLGNEGAQVAVASSGPMALGVLNREGPLPDLILMDIQMPEMDGYQATRAIQGRLGVKTPPIVAMTANALASDRIAALEAGMVDHIGKPFDLAQLVAVILQHARQGSAPPAAAAAVGDGGGALPDAGLNSVAALKRMGGLESVYLIALRSFMAEAEKLAGQLQAARSEQDQPAALAALHTLKGLAGTVGADRLATLSQQAEHALKQDASAWAPLDLVLDACPEVVEDIEQLLTESHRR